MTRHFGGVLFISLLCAARQVVEKPILVAAAEEGSRVAAVLKLALFPTLLTTSPGATQLTPHATDLLHTLLNMFESSAASEHWQGNDASFGALQELVRSGRALILTLSQGQQQSPQQDLKQQRKQQRNLDQRVQELSSWLNSVERALEEVPEGPSYPQLRRAVVALLAEVWSAAEVEGGGGVTRGSVARGADEAAMRILLGLYNQHAASAVRKSAVEYYHFSKAAGTSVCVTSAAMGCTTFSVKEQYTCLIPEFGDGPRWINRKAYNSRCRHTLPGFQQCITRLYSKLAKWGLRYNPRSAVLGCDERATWLSDRGFNFYASEYTLRGRGGNTTASPPALCTAFLNLAVLRAPRDRLLSHMRYIVRITYDWLGERTAKYLRNMTVQDWRRLLPAAFDNYYIRSLLGEEVFYARTGALNATEHLPSARRVLTAMDVVLLLEDPEPLLQLGHKWGLGWRTSFLQAEGRSSSHVSRDAARIAEQVLPTGAAEQELADANNLDEQLYDFAVLLSRLDAVVWAAAAAAGGRAPEDSATEYRHQRLEKEQLTNGRSDGYDHDGGLTAGHRPCGYVAVVLPKPTAPPPPQPNVTWVPRSPALV